MTRIILIRHGYSEGNQEKRFSGQKDVPLSEIGYRQAESVGKYLSAHECVDAIYASDLCRAYDTVLPLSRMLGIPIRKARELREVDVGLWQGMRIEDVARVYSETFSYYKSYPGLAIFDGGESYGDMLARVKPFLKELAEKHDGQTVAIATHGGVIRVLQADFDAVPLAEIQKIPHVPNASLTVFTWENGRITWERVGATDHLYDKITEEGVK